MSLTDWPGLDVEALPVPMTTNDVTVSLPPFEVLVDRWREISGMIHRATSRTGCYEPIDLLLMAARGEMGIWLCMRGDEILAVLVSQVINYPRRRVLEMVAAGGGNMAAWRDIAVRTLDQHARARGCAHVACIGRPGWARAWGGEATGDIVMVRGV